MAADETELSRSANNLGRSCRVDGVDLGDGISALVHQGVDGVAAVLGDVAPNIAECDRMVVPKV